MDGVKLMRKLREEKRKQQGLKPLLSSESMVPPPKADPAPFSSAHQRCWQRKALSVREWEIGERKILIYEDPMGKLQGGNGATLW